MRNRLLAQHVGIERLVLARPAAFWNAAEIFPGQHPLRQRREGNRSHAEARQRFAPTVALDPTVEHVVARLMDQQRCAQFEQDIHRLAGALRVIRRDPDIERLALPHDLVERAHGFFQRGIGIEAVRIEDIDVVEPHPLERLVERRDQVFARPPFAVGPGPHLVTGLGRDDQLVAVALEIGGENIAKGFLGAAEGGAVIVGEIEMGDAVVKRRAADIALGLVRRVVAEIVPQPEAHRRQLQPGIAAAIVDHALVTVFGGGVAGGKI